MINTTFTVISIFLISSSLLMLQTTNTIYSILYMILCFFFSSLLILQLGLDYIPLLFIIIYVGALSVLFIFVIMMLNIKTHKKQSYNFVFYVFLVFLVFLIFYSFNVNKIYFFYNQTSFNLVTKVNPICAVGLLLFTKYAIYILLSGLILFIAMVGSVVLVSTKDFYVKSQPLFKQVSSLKSQSFFMTSSIKKGESSIQFTPMCTYQIVKDKKKNAYWKF